MMVPSPFDHSTDPALGDALRDVLGVEDDPAFVRAVLEGTHVPQPWWDVLGDWARPSVAAALLLVAVGSFLLGRLVGPEPADIANGDVLQAGFEVSSLFAGGTAPNVETLLTDDTTR